MAKKRWNEMRVEEKLDELYKWIIEAQLAIDGQAQIFRFPEKHPSLIAMGKAIDDLQDDVSDLRQGH